MITINYSDVSASSLSEANKILPKCLECDKFYRSRVGHQCRVCRDLEFEEKILCDLNRAVQDDHNFICHAFRPRLNLVGSAAPEILTGPGSVDRKARHKTIEEIMASDKFKYQKALALQKLNQNPDEIFVELKYHLAWNVSHRKPVFSPGKKYFDFVLDTVMGCGDLVGGIARLLWLAPDHLHIYVESDGEKSIEAIVRKIKPFLKKALLANFPEIKKCLDKGTALWDNAYFSETLG
ncbi:MAG: transposase [Deltaproteobacteria bacterium]|nr:transposase [Deltaproteobacteria bacterium]